MTVVDIGANVGFYTLMAARLVGETGRVHAFEPSKPTLEKLRRNIAANRFTNIVVHEIALSDRNEERTFHHDEDPSRNRFGQVDTPDGEETIGCRSLDAELGRNARVDFIKIDVEGAELLVLRGALELLANNPNAAVMCEFSDLNAHSLGSSVAELTRFFRERKYELFAFDANTSTLVPIVRPEGFDGNVIAMRSGRHMLPKTVPDQNRYTSELECAV